MGEESPSPGGEQGRRPNPLRVLRNRNFARLFFAGAASQAGFAIGQVAVTWLVFSVTRSAVNVALVGISFFLAIIVLSLLAGTLVDRQDRRRLMIIADLVRCATLALATVFLYLFGFNLIMLLSVVFVLGAFTTVFQPAERALTPTLIERDQIADANGLTQTTTSLAQFVSNAAGGLLIAGIGAMGALGLNSLTFLVSASLLATIVIKGPQTSAAQPERRNTGYLEDAKEGIRYLAGQRGLLSMTLLSSIGNVFLTMVFAFIVVYSTVIINGNATVYGLMLAAFSLGVGPGSLAVSRLGAIRWAGKGFIVGGGLQGVFTLLLVLYPSQPAAYACTFSVGFLLGFINTTWLTTVQLTVPGEMQGRFFGVDQLGSFATIPLGQVLGGLLVATRGVTFTFELAGLGMLLTSGLFLLLPSARGWAYRERPLPGPSQSG